MTLITKEHFTNYLQCLKEERYFDAHEALEDAWFKHRFKTEIDEVMLIKGFINAAVSFELVKRGRKNSALKVWKNYKKYIVLLESLDSIYIDEYKNLQKYVQILHKRLHS